MQFTLTSFNWNKGFTFPKFDKHPFDNAVSIIRDDGTIIGATFFDGKTCWVCPAIDPLLRDAIKKQARNYYVLHHGEDMKLSDVQKENGSSKMAKKVCKFLKKEQTIYTSTKQ